MHEKKLQSAAVKLSLLASLVGLFTVGGAAGYALASIQGIETQAGGLLFTLACACLVTGMNVLLAWSNLRMAQEAGWALDRLRAELRRLQGERGRR